MWEEIALICNDTHSATCSCSGKVYMQVALVDILEKHWFHSVAFRIDRIR